MKEFWALRYVQYFFNCLFTTLAFPVIFYGQFNSINTLKYVNSYFILTGQQIGVPFWDIGKFPFPSNRVQVSQQFSIVELISKCY